MHKKRHQIRYGFDLSSICPAPTGIISAPTVTGVAPTGIHVAPTVFRVEGMRGLRLDMNMDAIEVATRRVDVRKVRGVVECAGVRQAPTRVEIEELGEMGLCRNHGGLTSQLRLERCGKVGCCPGGAEAAR